MIGYLGDIIFETSDKKICNFITKFGGFSSFTEESLNMGIRCKSGAVPAAVSPILFCKTHSATVAFCSGKALQKQDKPEDLPVFSLL